MEEGIGAGEAPPLLVFGKLDNLLPGSEAGAPLGGWEGGALSEGYHLPVVNSGEDRHLDTSYRSSGGLGLQCGGAGFMDSINSFISWMTPLS